jgi:hypothetical protein
MYLAQSLVNASLLSKKLMFEKCYFAAFNQ